MVIAHIYFPGHPSGLEDLSPRLLGVLLAESPQQSTPSGVSLAEQSCHAQGYAVFPAAHTQGLINEWN